MNTKLLVLLAALIMPFVASAQYFEDSTFVNQVQVYLKPATLRSESRKQALDGFLAQWTAGLTRFQPDIVDVFNGLYSANAGKEAYFTLIDVINKLVDDDKTEVLDKMLGVMTSLKPGDLQDYADYVHNFLFDSLIVYHDRLQIKILSGNFSYTLTKKGFFNVQSTGSLDIAVFYFADTVKIKQTTGSYDSRRKKWSGSSGKLVWKALNDSVNSTYVMLRDYVIPVHQLSFKVENTSLYLSSPLISASNIQGRLEFNFTRSASINVQNPVFVAYDEITKKNLLPNTDFQGYIRVKGQEIRAKGQMIFKYDNKPVIFTKSDDYLIMPTFLKASNVDMKIQTGSKFIEHPSVNMTLLYDTVMIARMYPYLFEKIIDRGKPMILSFYRTADGEASRPFYDYYHNLIINVSEIAWIFGKNLYFLRTQSDNYSEPEFLSMNYFEPDVLKDFYDPMGVNYAGMFYKYLRTKHYPDTVRVGAFFGYLSRRGIKTSLRYTYSQLQKMSWLGWFDLTYDQDLSKAIVYNINPVFVHEMKANIRNNLVQDRRFNLLDKYSEDYDVIKIKAGAVLDSVGLIQKLNYFTLRSAGVVAKMSFDTYVLDILRPEPFYLSKIRKVKVFPKELKIREDLNFTFDGKVEAGLTQLNGTDFEFNYPDFSLDLNHVDRMKMWFWSPVDSVVVKQEVDTSGDTIKTYAYNYKLDSVMSYLRNFQAFVKIDTPTNKSGVLAQQGDGYPWLKSLTNSKIYYPQAPVDSSNFYFLNYPFVLKGLPDLTKSSVSMTGLFHSSILEDLDSLKLTVQDDNSLGFIKYDTTQGFKILGAASLLGYLKLDNKGLHSVANLKFLSTVVRGDFILKPDTLSGTTDSTVVNPVDADLKKKLDLPATYPYITYKGNGKILLYSNADSTQTMKIEVGKSKGFQLYPNYLKDQERGVLDSGKIYITYSGVQAVGRMNFIDAQLLSRKFDLDYDNFSADTCQFVYKDSTFKENLFNTKNVSCYMDLVTRVGTFVANDIDNYITFPKNRYLVYSDHFLWKINKGLIDIGGEMNDPRYVVVRDTAMRDSLLQTGKYNPKMIRLAGTRLVSMKRVNPLNFQASRSVFDPYKTVLKAFDVPELKIADTRIKPSGPVIIRVGGLIDSLRSARLYVGKYEHKIYDAVVYVKDSKYYKARGYYTYRDTQRIYFNSIAPMHNDTVSMGEAYLEQGRKLYLNDYFIYTSDAGSGKITMYGNKLPLHFGGAVKLTKTCDLLKPRRLLVDADINKDTVLIPVSYPIQGLDYQKNVVTYTASPVLTQNGSKFTLENTFITFPKSLNYDKILAKVDGYISYLPQKAYYMIGSREKILHPDTALPMVAYQPYNCLILAQDKFDLGVDFGDDFQYSICGNYIGILQDEKYSFDNLTVRLNFPYLDKILGMITRDLQDMEEPQFLDFEQPEAKKIKNSIMLCTQDKKEKTSFAQDMVIPKSLAGTIVLTDVSLVWDKNRGSLRTPAGKNRFAIMYINGKEQEIYVNGYLEFSFFNVDMRRNPRMARMYLYLDLGDGKYYFFKYTFDRRKGYMAIESYNKKAENYIASLEPKKRQLTKKFQVGVVKNKNELKQFLNLYKAYQH